MSFWKVGETLPWSKEDEARVYAEDTDSDEDTPPEEAEGDTDDETDTEYSSVANGDDETDEFDTNHCFFRLSQKYEYEECLAFNVWSAIDHTSDEKKNVVVKVEPYSTKHIEGQPPKGVRILAALNRLGLDFAPNLVKWYDMGVGKHNEEERRYVVVTDLIPSLGRDEALEVLFNDKNKCKSYLRQLFEAVRKVHEVGVIHRDLKPGNIMWDDENEKLYLIDWTLSTFKRPNGKTHTRYVGTRAYKCPQMANENEYDHRCDIYSLGIICGQFAMKVDDQEVEDDEVRNWHREYDRLPTTSTAAAGCNPNRSKGMPRRKRANKRVLVLNTEKKQLLDLFTKMTQRNPDKRITLDEALEHAYFK